MTKFALFDADGLPTAFFSEEIHGARTLPVHEDDGDGNAAVSGSKPNPDCMIPPAAIAIPDGQWMEFLANAGCRIWRGGTVVAYSPPAVAPSLSDYTTAIEAMLDAGVKERGYDGALSIASYAGSTNAQWAAEAQAFVAWRDRVWEYCHAEMDKVQAGKRTQPDVAAFVAEIKARLPMTWPG